MAKQLGFPTYSMTLSCADLRWLTIHMIQRRQFPKLLLALICSQVYLCACVAFWDDNEFLSYFLSYIIQSTPARAISNIALSRTKLSVPLAPIQAE